MDSLDVFRRFAHYNRWMNDKLYAASACLSKDQRNRDMEAFFRSIHGTLNHILLADRVWLGRLEGRPFEVRSLDQVLYAEFATLTQARKQADREIEDMVSMLQLADLDTLINYWSIASSKPNTVSRGLILHHLFNHQTHHRGQVTAMLSQLGHDYGVTDLIALPD